MDRLQDLTLEEMANIFCMESDELKEYLNTREFNISYNEKNGELEFPLENVQKHLRSQYFI